MRQILRNLGIEIIDADAATETVKPAVEVDLIIPDNIPIDTLISMCLKGIGRVPLLTAEQEREFVLRMELHNENERSEAEKHLAEANVRSCQSRNVTSRMALTSLI